MATTAQENCTQQVAIRDLIFAELALRDGKTPPEAIQKGRKVLEEMGRFGINRSLPSILVERNLIDRKRERDLARGIAGLEVSCAHCRRPVSLEDLGQEGHLRCGQCRSLLSVQVDEGGEGKKPGIEDRLKSLVLERGKADRKAEGGKSQKKGRQPPAPSQKPPAAASQPRSLSETPRAEGTPAEKRRIQARDAIHEFRIEGVLASGPCGRLYRALPSDGKGPPVALKVISPGHLPDSRSLRGLQAALAAWNRLPRESFVPHEFHEENSISYIVRPLLQAPWVALSDLKPDGLKDGPGILGAIASHLKTVHEAKGIHGNLKPSNVYLNQDHPEQVLLVDPAQHLLSPKNDEIARWKHLAGSPRYAPPEEIAGGESTPASDIYSLGWILYTLLSGGAPFLGLSPPEVLRRHREGPCPELPVEMGGFRKLHLSMTALAASERPPDAGEALARLQEIEARKKPSLGTVTPRPVSSEEDRRRSRKGLSDWPFRYVLGPLALIALLGWMGLNLSSWQVVRAAFSDKKRPAALYLKLAEEAFEETKARAGQDPRSGLELWEKYLHSFADTPLRGAAEAEKRNFQTNASGPSGRK